MAVQSSKVSRIDRESHAFRCNLTLACLHKYFSCISTLLVGNSTVLDIRLVLVIVKFLL